MCSMFCIEELVNLFLNILAQKAISFQRNEGGKSNKKKRYYIKYRTLLPEKQENPFKVV